MTGADETDHAGVQWDAVIVGGGASGLSLAYHLAKAGWGDRVAIVDDAAFAPDDRSWAWWSHGDCLLDAEASAEFTHVVAAGRDWHRRGDLSPYAYRSMNGLALSDATDAAIAMRPGYRRIGARALGVEQAPDAAVVTIERPSGKVERLRARWVFDSAGAGEGGVDPRSVPHLDFSGRYLECGHDAFDPSAVTLMDFRTDQSDGVAFMYVLPTSARTALVERTVFVHPLTTTAEAVDHEAQLDTYVAATLGLTGARVTGAEAGVIPLVVRRPARSSGRVIPIGARAGMVRASTGYAFERIQRHSEEITRRLLAGRHPGGAVRPERWLRVLDAALLRVIRVDPDAVRAAFAAMLARQPAPRTLAFLDGTAGPLDQARIFASLPLFRFARAQVIATLARRPLARRA